MIGDTEIRPFIEVPQSFLDMPRWWHEGEAWLAALSTTVDTVCERWHLVPDGEIMHGSNAVVLPVRRNGELLALRLTLPDERTESEVSALRFWNGRGMVRLVHADPAIGASLLERLDGSRSLAQVPLAEAVPILATLMRRWALPAPTNVPSTADMAAQRVASMPVDWHRLGEPFDREMLDAAIRAGHILTHTNSQLAANGDLHFAQVLAGQREPWLAVDPVLLRGDIEYDLARILWSRLDEMTSDKEVLHRCEVIVSTAALEQRRAHAWVVFRTVDYWLWGLGHGLTEDPKRCARLARIFSATHRQT